MREFRVIVNSDEGDLEVSGTAHPSWSTWSEEKRAEYLDWMYGAGNWRYN